MSKRVFLILVIFVFIAIGLGFTSIDTSGMQSDMNNFEDQLTSNGIVTTINNSSFLGDVALKLQGLIDMAMSALLAFFNKLISIFN